MSHMRNVDTVEEASNRALLNLTRVPRLFITDPEKAIAALDDAAKWIAVARDICKRAPQ